MNDFDKWNNLKQEIDSSATIDRKVYLGDVWWCNLGKNIGSEEDGKHQDFSRPILILKVLSKNTYLVAPLTTSKNKHYFRIPIGDVDGKEAKAIISQIKVIDKRRLQERIKHLSKSKMQRIKKSVKDIL